MASPSGASKTQGLRRRLALATAGALVLGIGAIWLQSADQPAATERTAPPPPAGRPFLITPDVPRAGLTPDTLTALPETLNPSGTSADLLDRILQRQASRQLFAGPQDVERARSKDALLEPARRDVAIGHLPFLTERQRTDQRDFIRYDARTLDARVEGDQFDLLLPGIGMTVKAVIDQVESVDGMLRWSGHLLDVQEGGQFSITHASQDRYAVGTFNTPLGNFSMEASNGWGWVVSQDSDFFLPPDGNDALHPIHEEPPVPTR